MPNASVVGGDGDRQQQYDDNTTGDEFCDSSHGRGVRSPNAPSGLIGRFILMLSISRTTSEENLIRLPVAIGNDVNPPATA